MYEQRLLRRRRITLAALVGLSVILLTLSFGEPRSGVLGVLQRGVQTVLAPLEAGASVAITPITAVTHWVGGLSGAQGERDELQTEVSRLRGDLARARLDRRDADQLRRLADLRRRRGFPGGGDPVTARVIARSPTVWHTTIQIDRGRSDGVKLHQPVVTGDGLVGSIESVGSGTANVQLITNASSAVSAQVLPAGANGVVKPEIGDPNDLLLDFVEQGRRIREGSDVVTSGIRSSRLESLFPRGVPIGEVTRVEREELAVYQRVHLRPFADLREMDYVQVLTDGRRPQPVQAAAR